jgi:hypothetical protein
MVHSTKPVYLVVLNLSTGIVKFFSENPAIIYSGNNPQPLIFCRAYYRIPDYFAE